jgi:hypothetical protein
MTIAPAPVHEDAKPCQNSVKNPFRGLRQAARFAPIRTGSDTRNAAPPCPGR